MLQGRIALIGVGADVLDQPDGTKLLRLVDDQLEVLVPLSAEASTIIGNKLSKPAVIIAQGNVPRA